MALSGVLLLRIIAKFALPEKQTVNRAFFSISCKTYWCRNTFLFILT